MIKPQDIRVGSVLLYLTSEGEWMHSVMDWQDIKWISEDPVGFNAVHKPIEIEIPYEKTIKFFHQMQDLKRVLTGQEIDISELIKNS